MAFAAMPVMVPAFAASASAATGPSAVRTVAQPDRVAGVRGDDDSAGVSGLEHESPVCSALDSETIPTGGVVARCLVGTHLL